jgi:hypothetical protein
LQLVFQGRSAAESPRSLTFTVIKFYSRLFFDIVNDSYRIKTHEIRL